MENYCRAGHDTVDMRIACWIAKATNTDSDPVFQVIFIMFKYVEHSTYFSIVFFSPPFLLSAFNFEFHLWILFNNL